MTDKPKNAINIESPDGDTLETLATAIDVTMFPDQGHPDETTPPDDVVLSSEIAIPIEHPERGPETWVFNWSEISPIQHIRASKLLFYEHELLVNPLPSHRQNKLSGLYEIEMEMFSVLLLRKNEDGTLDRRTPMGRVNQEAEALEAIYLMKGSDYDKLRIIKKNLCLLYGVPSVDRTLDFKKLTRSLAGYISAFSHLKLSESDISTNSETTDTGQHGNEEQSNREQ